MTTLGTLGGNSHLTTLEGDNHLVVGDEGRLGAVKGDPHALLGACCEDVRQTQQPPRSLPPNQPTALAPPHSRRGKAVVPVVRLLRATPYGGTLWFRYSSELTAKTTTPPGGGQLVGGARWPPRYPPPSRPSPIGLGTARAWVQSKGRLVRDQMTGCTFCVMFSEMATMEHVSCRTATRLGPQRVGQPGPSVAHETAPRRPIHPSPQQRPHPGQVWLGSNRMSRVGS